MTLSNCVKLQKKIKGKLSKIIPGCISQKFLKKTVLFYKVRWKYLGAALY